MTHVYICCALDEATCSQRVDTAPKGWKDDSLWVKGIRSQFGAKGRKALWSRQARCWRWHPPEDLSGISIFESTMNFFAFDRIRYESELWCTRKTGPTPEETAGDLSSLHNLKLGQTESSMTLSQSVGAEQPKSTTFTTTGHSDGETSKPKSRIILDPLKTDHDVQDASTS